MHAWRGRKQLPGAAAFRASQVTAVVMASSSLCQAWLGLERSCVSARLDLHGFSGEGPHRMFDHALRDWLPVGGIHCVACRLQLQRLLRLTRRRRPRLARTSAPNRVSGIAQYAAAGAGQLPCSGDASRRGMGRSTRLASAQVLAGGGDGGFEFYRLARALVPEALPDAQSLRVARLCALRLEVILRLPGGRHRQQA